MNERFLGVPVLVWGIACFGLAVVFAFVWPRERAAGDPSGLRYLILRWAHAAVWLLLGVSCVVRLLGERGAGPANGLAMLAGLVYLTFIVNLVRG